jgi:hypothetical protein
MAKNSPKNDKKLSLSFSFLEKKFSIKKKEKNFDS